MEKREALRWDGGVESGRGRKNERFLRNVRGAVALDGFTDRGRSRVVGEGMAPPPLGVDEPRSRSVGAT